MLTEIDLAEALKRKIFFDLRILNAITLSALTQ